MFVLGVGILCVGVVGGVVFLSGVFLISSC